MSALRGDYILNTVTGRELDLVMPDGSF